MNYYGVKATKHFVWLVFSLWTGFTFVGYFTPIYELADKVITWNLGGWEMFWIFFYGFATYGNAGFMREQVCIYMCPYARFQSAMIDKNSLIISYDEKRGDPRGGRKRGTDSASIGKGDCIDCGLCVQVCPTAIDIRDGLQYQCIGCAACVDVCDDVMSKMRYPKGLISYTTENALAKQSTKVFRPRVIAYAVIILLVSALLANALITRVPLEVDIIRDRSNLYSENQQGFIENVYALKIINMDEKAHDFQIQVEGLPGIVMHNQQVHIQVASGAVADLPLRVMVDPEDIPAASNTIYFTITAADDAAVQHREQARFLGPIQR